MRWTIVALLVILNLVAVNLVAACSTMPSIAEMTTQAEVVALGTFIETSADVAILQVDEYWKGSVTTATLRINNHRFETTEDCRLQLGPDQRFSQGSRVVAFLQKDEFQVGADWRPTGLGGLYILAVDQDQLVYVEQAMGSVAEARTQITAATQVMRTPQALASQAPTPAAAVAPSAAASPLPAPTAESLPPPSNSAVPQPAPATTTGTMPTMLLILSGVVLLGIVAAVWYKRPR